MMSDSSTVVWDAPGPGQWALDRSHMPAGTTPIVQHIVTPSMPSGMRRMFAELGSPLDTHRRAFRERTVLLAAAPTDLARQAGEEAAAQAGPEARHPTAPRDAPAQRDRGPGAGLRAVERSDPRVAPRWQGRASRPRNLELQDVDLESLDDDELLGHVRECIDHCLQNWEHHFWLHGYDLGPIGRYLYESASWGPTPDELLSLLEGASPSTSAPARALVELRRAVESHGATPTTLDELRSLSPEIAAAVDDFLRHRGVVLFSRYDLDGISLGERPDLVLAIILNAEHTRHVRGGCHSAPTRSAHRCRSSTSRGSTMLLGQARSAMDLRDDNGPTTAEWPLGAAAPVHARVGLPAARPRA